MELNKHSNPSFKNVAAGGGSEERAIALDSKTIFFIRYTFKCQEIAK